MLIIDDYSWYIVSFIMKRKIDVLERFQEFAILVENQFGWKIKVLRSDNGGEYISNEFTEFLKKQGIAHDETIPYSPQQNGVAERAK